MTLRLGLLAVVLVAVSVACSNGGGAIPTGANSPASPSGAARARATAVANPNPSPTPLLVGPGRSFPTVASALAASKDGDTIDVVSGTYTNDFSYVNHSVTIQGVGGMVKMVATEPIPNEKGILVVEKGLSIKNFEFSGAEIPASEGNNGAGIRAEGGNLFVQYCYFHDNQDGILAPENLTASTSRIDIDRSEFSHNGAGDGYSHNAYIGPVYALTFRRNYSHDAVVGHELKSRAENSDIQDNVFADGTSGTASYEIDVPNAGYVYVRDNVIEKGPGAQNPAAVHYGGETQYHWAKNVLTVASNAIINNYGPNATAVLNQSKVNGITVTANLSLNKIYGFASSDIVSGLGDVLSNNVIFPSAASAPPIPTVSPWAFAPVVPIPVAP